VSDASLRRAYTVFAPLYDWLFGRATGGGRRRSLDLLRIRPGERVLLLGVGTGLDLPHLPGEVAYEGVDLARAMLRRAVRRAERLGLRFVAHEASASALPVEAGRFDAAILHLILAVVHDPVAALKEVERVLRPGGRAVIWDKMLRDGGRPSRFRRAVHALTHRWATGVLLDLPAVLRATPSLCVTHRESSLFGGTWQIVVLEKAPGGAGDDPVPR
jgi:phosphatidylethanolamine/phosphatidyl-N-methylethanolamine N-methyltransferase